MIELESIVALVLLVALTCYALFGGADFGAGVWHLLAKGPTRREQHRLIGHAIGPIWEANHVWLILIITILFTAFPSAYAKISITLHIPLTLLVIGIVLRGAAYAFHHYDVKGDEIHARWDQIFALSSFMAPVFLGIIVGTITIGNFPSYSEGFFKAYVSPWIQPFPLIMGVFTLFLFAYLAAVYLLLEAQQDERLQEIFRKRTLVIALVVGILEEVVLIIGRSSAPRLWGELTSSLWGVSLQFGVGALTLTAVWFLLRRRFWWARTCAILQVILTLWAWGIAQFPYLVPPDLTIFNTSAPEVTLQLVGVAIILGSLLLFPSLYYLLRVFKDEILFNSKD